VGASATTGRRTQQRSFDDCGTPLADVVFVVLDLETTGAAPNTCEITEIGAAKYQGGACTGTFQTLVNPGVPIPPMITMLTGITEAMVYPAPRVESVLPTLLEFIGDGVIVGHNIRFDISFLDAALVRTGRPRIANQRVDTVALARRLVRDEVPNCQLGTLARHFRTAVQPTHRALDDTLATAEVLHIMIERASAFGVFALDDLMTLPTMAHHPSAAKLKLTTHLPRQPGVYMFRDAGGRILYVGKATNLRARVRSYFSSDDRRKIPQLLRETVSIDHVVCRGPLEAAVLELRLIQQHEPRFNRQSKSWRAYSYVKLTLGERFPRLAVVREPRDDGALYIGPLRSAAVANTVREAIETAVPLRRCNKRMPAKAQLDSAGPPCVPAQLGVASCPCTGYTSEGDYASVVDRARRALTGEPHLVLDELARRMRELAAVQRFEEAADTRHRLSMLARALRRQRVLAAARAVERLVVECRDGLVELRCGAFALARARPVQAEFDQVAARLALLPPPPETTSAVVARSEVDEMLVVASFLDSEAARGTLRVHAVDGTLALPLPHIPTYEPIEPRRR
jgi:DNA polymerase-3 subunit epsilon